MNHTSHQACQLHRNFDSSFFFLSHDEMKKMLFFEWSQSLIRDPLRKQKELIINTGYTPFSWKREEDPSFHRQTFKTNSQEDTLVWSRNVKKSMQAKADHSFIFTFIRIGLNAPLKLKSDSLQELGWPFLAQFLRVESFLSESVLQTCLWCHSRNINTILLWSQDSFHAQQVHWGSLLFPHFSVYSRIILFPYFSVYSRITNSNERRCKDRENEYRITKTNGTFVATLSCAKGIPILNIESEMPHGRAGQGCVRDCDVSCRWSGMAAHMIFIPDFGRSLYFFEDEEDEESEQIPIKKKKDNDVTCSSFV